MDNPIAYSPEGRRTRIAYVTESTLENLKASAAGGVFITMLLKQLGFSDSLTGIITSLSTFACTAMIFASGAAMRTKSIKGFVLRSYAIYHSLLVLLFLLPFIRLPHAVTVFAFICCYLGGSILYNILFPNKFNWLMSCVPESQHGRFTANREMIVLVVSTLFTYPFSAKIDALKQAGKTDNALLLCCSAIAVFSVGHLIALSRTVDVPRPAAPKEANRSMWQLWMETLADRRFLKLLPIAIVYTAAVMLSSAYYTVYEMQELSFSIKFIAALSILSTVVRVLISRPLGKFADRFGFCAALTLAFGIFAVAYGIVAFTNPGNGKLMFLLFTAFNAVGGAISGTGIHTLTFSYVPQERRTTALGIYGSLGGIFGFVGSLIGGLIVSLVQKQGGMKLFGTTVYAQQINSAVTCLLMLSLVVYMNTVIRRMPTLNQLAEQKKAEAQQAAASQKD